MSLPAIQFTYHLLCISNDTVIIRHICRISPQPPTAQIFPSCRNKPPHSFRQRSVQVMTPGLDSKELNSYFYLFICVLINVLKDPAMG